jgi:hypothetical protein
LDEFGQASSGSSTDNPKISGTPARGQSLRWTSVTGSITNLAASQTLTLKFRATTVTGFNASSSVKNTTTTGTWNVIQITASGQATVVAGKPGYITVIIDAVPNDAQDFAFALINQAKPQDPTGFVLNDDADGTYSNTVQFGLKAGTYSVSETAVPGWDLTTATSVSSAGGKLPTPSNIVLHEGETVTRTLTNRKQIPQLELTKSSSPATYSAVG